MLLIGIGLRLWMFEQTRPIRFMEDMNRGYKWGDIARRRGVLNLYDMMRNQPTWARLWLDYAPLRLMTMWGWTSINSSRFEEASNYQNTLTFALPVIVLNTIADVASGVAVFVLVRRFSTRVRAFIASTCLFLNPAILVSGYAWMTWDGWLIPFFLCALYFSLRDRWWISGLLVGLGALFKGQIAFSAILFVVWPLMQGRWQYSLRWIAGAAFTIGLGVSPWMLRTATGSINLTSIVWVASVLVTTAIALSVTYLRGWGIRRWLWIAAGALGVSLLLCMKIANASDAWFICGYEYGTRHFDRLDVGLPDNIPAVLDKTFDFGSDTDVYYPLFNIAGYTLTLKPAMQMLTLAFTLACTIAASRLQKNNDSRILIAAVLPWFFVYLLPLQIHERYLLYFAASSMCFLGSGVGPMAVGAVASGIAALSTLAVLLKPERLIVQVDQSSYSLFVRHGAALRDFAMFFHPNAAWLLLAMALWLLVLVWLPAKNRSAVLFREFG